MAPPGRAGGQGRVVRAPALRAVMERRLLVNYRVDPELLASLLPAPFRPILVGGYGVAGICLIRLAGIRPAGVPAGAGLTSPGRTSRAVPNGFRGVLF